MMRYAAILATALLFGCGGGATTQSALAPTQTLSVARDATGAHPWLYVGGFSNNVVAIYDLEKFGTPQIGTITNGINGPGGLAIDSQGTLYVANQSAGNVTIYPAGTIAPSLTLSQGLQSPQSVAVDSHGNVYVCNRGSAPAIVVYPPGQTTPSQTITSSLIQSLTQIAFDSAGDLYFGDSNTGVSKIPASSTTPVSLNLQGLARTDGIARDPVNGNLYVGNFGNGKDEVLVYAPGNVNPVRTLNHSDGADLFDIGRMQNTEYLFAPDSYINVVHVFKHGRSNPVATISVAAAHYPVGLAFKHAGIP
jgi:serine/threonine protein kinase, bacterial